MLKLKARNFRRFQEPEPVIFLPGLTIVSGPNGAGKSTLVEALIYALFGAKRGQAGDIQPDSATGATGVECELIIDGQTVRVCRFNDRAELWINNALQVQDISTSSRVANTQLRRLLGGLTREQFEGTYVALQGDTAGLVEEKTKRDRDQRREIIESVLQLEVLRKAVENQERLRDRTLDEAKDKGKSCIDEL
jgi:DNA repair protein SbcC/Rad50